MPTCMTGVVYDYEYYDEEYDSGENSTRATQQTQPANPPSLSLAKQVLPSVPRNVATRVPQGVPDTASGTKPEGKVVHTEDAKMQNAISTELNIPDGYLKASALIIRWHKNLDQFPGHDEEIAKLAALFKSGFNYDVEVFTLNVETKPQHQLNLAITSFVNKYDGPHNLMIVYYTGHGRWYEEGKVLEFVA